MPDRPNILFILTDQQSATMMSCAGNPYVKTPAMDSLAATGRRFDRAYCTNPVCVPSRFSLMTGRLPGEIGLRSCDISPVKSVPQHILDGGLGWQMQKAGYEATYAGKVHLPRMTPEEIGFSVLTDDERDELAEEAAVFVGRPHEKPFFLCASFINPHDICYQAIRDFAETDWEKHLIAIGQTEIATLDEASRLPDGVSEERFFREICPPLPPNHEPQVDEPEALLSYLARAPFKQKARERYTERIWRLHRWAYARLTERVDAQIGRVLDALRSGGNADNTVVVFTSDHGDHDSSHKLEHKTAFYEEACRIPLIISQPGVNETGVCADLASNGLDLLPTFCDYAGVESPEGLSGQSLRPLAEARAHPAVRECLPLENEFGRMIVTERFKYMLHDDGDHREQLIDLENDPGETRNALYDDANAEALERCRALFAQQFG